MTPLWKGETKEDNICKNRRNTVFGWITTPYTLSKYLTNLLILQIILKYNQTFLHHYFPRYTNIIHKHTYILTLSQCKRFKAIGRSGVKKLCVVIFKYLNEPESLLFTEVQNSILFKSYCNFNFRNLVGSLINFRTKMNF